MRHDVVNLRDVRAPEVSVHDRAGVRWMRVEDAERAGVHMNGYGGTIGPRRRGVVYWGAYWGDVNTVHDVFVKVAPIRRRGKRRREVRVFAGVVGCLIMEESVRDHGRIRSHMTSWEYDRRNQPLFTIGQ